MRRHGEGIPAAIENATAIHYINDPKHAHAMLRQLKGVVDKLYAEADDDPLLYAYAIKSFLPLMATIVLSIEQWTVAVIDATPDQLPTQGATLCR